MKGRGQIERHALKLRLNAQLALSALETQAGGVGACAIGMLGEQAERGNFFRLSQAIGRHLPLNANERVGFCAARGKLSGATF